MIEAHGGGGVRMFGRVAENGKPAPHEKGTKQHSNNSFDRVEKQKTAKKQQ